MNRPAASSSATELPPPSTDPDEERRRPARAAWIRLAFLVALLLALGSWVALGGGDLLRDVRQWVDSLGVWGRSSSRSSTPWL